VVRLFVVDNQELSIRGIRSLVSEHHDLEIAGTSPITNGVETILQQSLPVDVIVQSLTTSGSRVTLELTKKLRNSFPDIPILIHGMYDETGHIQEAFTAGAKGYVTTMDSPLIFLAGIRSLSRGGTYLSPTVGVGLLQYVQQLPTNEAPPERVFSDREIEIFTCLGQGLSAKEIAAQLNRSVSTINTHVDRMKRKLNLSSSADLVFRAYQWVQKRYISDDPASSPDVR